MLRAWPEAARQAPLATSAPTLRLKRQPTQTTGPARHRPRPLLENPEGSTKSGGRDAEHRRLLDASVETSGPHDFAVRLTSANANSSIAAIASRSRCWRQARAQQRCGGLYRGREREDQFQKRPTERIESDQFWQRQSPAFAFSWAKKRQPCFPFCLVVDIVENRAVASTSQRFTGKSRRVRLEVDSFSFHDGWRSR